jgi:tetratricopeptide (TPR) repeat protein
MADHPSFDTLARSHAAHQNGQAREALALAAASYRMLRDIPGAPRDAAIIPSWYGLLLGTVGNRASEGLALCRNAASELFWEPRVHENLARLEMACGHRKEAVSALERGLAIAPENRELRELRHQLGRRRKPPLPFLDRSHPLNRVLGRLFYKQSGGPT